MGLLRNEVVAGRGLFEETISEAPAGASPGKRFQRLDFFSSETEPVKSANWI